jgi:gas vesicle protein
MEAVLIVAIVVVAAAALYVAATFNKRTRQTTAPLLDEALKIISEQINATAEDLRRQVGQIGVQQEQLSGDLRQLAARLGREPELPSTADGAPGVRGPGLL